jgi:hypothetical protein
MSIRERLFTRDIADAAAKRRERLREEERRDLRPPADTPAADSPDRIDPAPPWVGAKPDARAVIEPADRVAAGTESHAIFPGEEAGGFKSRWEAVQTGFVDEPRAAVEQADALVAQVMTRLAEVFSAERSQLEQQWDRGDNISTEDLRIALKRYRAFFDRLLSV